jgi:PAS domain-containing protein
VLWGLVLALALPAILVAAGGFYSIYQADQQATDRRLQETVRALSLSLDREIDKSLLALQVMAQSPHIANGNFEAFYQQAENVSLADPSWISLFEPGGRALVNTRIPYGSPLPDSNRLNVLRQVQETRKPHLSDLDVGSVSGRFRITLDVPVILDEKVAYILSLAMGPDAFQAIIRDQRIADGWNAAVLDRSGKIVARSRSPEQFVGQFASPYVRDAIAVAPEGNLRSVTLDGIPVRTYFSQSQTYGWAFAISMPEAEIAKSVERSLFWLLILAGVVLSGILLAALLSRAIAKPIDRLVAAAHALGRGEEVTGSATTRVLEFDTIQKALSEAATDIRTHEQEREETLSHMAESEARLRLALNAGDLGSWEFTPSTGAFITSAACRANFGRGPHEPFTYADLVASIHPEDRQGQADAVAEAVANRTDLHVARRQRALGPGERAHADRRRRPALHGRRFPGRHGAPACGRAAGASAARAQSPGQEHPGDRAVGGVPDPALCRERRSRGMDRLHGPPARALENPRSSHEQPMAGRASRGRAEERAGALPGFHAAPHPPAGPQDQSPAERRLGPGACSS